MAMPPTKILSQQIRDALDEERLRRQVLVGFWIPLGVQKCASTVGLGLTHRHLALKRRRRLDPDVHLIFGGRICVLFDPCDALGVQPDTTG